MAAHHPAPTLPVNSRMQALFWRLPYVSIGLMAACILLFVWLGLNSEREELRTKLVNDVLWMEQHLHLHFESVESALIPLVGVLDDGDQLSDDARGRVRQLLQSDTGLTTIYWLDIAGAFQLAVPPHDDSSQPSALEDALKRARTLSKSAYSIPFRQEDGGWGMAVVLPGYDGDRLTGFLVAEYSLGRLLVKQVPWWFAERYRLRINDSLGSELASTTSVNAIDTDLSYQVSLDPPGGDVALLVESYVVPSQTTPRLMVGAVVVFGLIMLWSLWMLRRQLVRLNATQMELRAEHAFRLAMENSMLVGIRARDLDGRITYVNAAFCKMLGYGPEELIGMRPPMSYWLTEDESSGAAAENRILNSRDIMEAVEVRYRRKDGDIFDALLFEAPLIDANGQHAGWMGSVLDVTERKRAEALAQAQQDRLEATSRLVTMGEMASSLAHEINQPLSAISSYSAGCMNALQSGRLDNEELGSVLGKINLQAQRAGRIIRRVYAFVRRSEPKRERLDINQTVLDACGLIETDARKRNARIETALDRNLPLLYADPVMIEQVLVNLMRNGIDAMNDLPVNERVLRVLSMRQDDRMIISVMDRGAGVAPEIADKLFDSFFTTKAEGMGMGLKICRSIVEQHKGRLWFENMSPRGAVFHLQLPITATPDEISAQAEPASAG